MVKEGGITNIQFTGKTITSSIMGHELTIIDPQHRGRENKSKGPITTGVMQEVETGVY